jgi:hypothetical protein
MQKGASRGKPTPEVSGVGGQDRQTLPVSSVDLSFAVIHDDYHLTIVFEDGQFKGEVVDGTLDKLEEARIVAAGYNLVIDHVRVAYDSPTFILTLSERQAPPSADDQRRT